MNQQELRKRITIEPGKRSGQPCIRGMRITVYDILSYLASGMTQEEILEDFPYLEKEDILAALAFAAEMGNQTMVAAWFITIIRLDMDSTPDGFLLDNMIAPRVCEFLLQILPQCSHVSDNGLIDKQDSSIADFALNNNLVIVTKDKDFYWLSVDRPKSPKVIWLQAGNTSTNQIISLLNSHISMLNEFLKANRTFLIIK